MPKLEQISSPYNSHLATLPTINENFSEFNTIDDPRTNISIVQGNPERIETEIETETETEIAINYDVEGEDDLGPYPQYVTYVDHPIIKNKFNLEFENQEPSGSSQQRKMKKDVNIHFDGIVNFYFASIGVVGLFILFRTIQKSIY
jgi:hypothetical protein